MDRLRRILVPIKFHERCGIFRMHMTEDTYENGMPIQYDIDMLVHYTRRGRGVRITQIYTRLKDTDSEYIFRPRRKFHHVYNDTEVQLQYLLLDIIPEDAVYKDLNTVSKVTLAGHDRRDYTKGT